MNESKNCSCNCGCHPVDSEYVNQSSNTTNNTDNYISTPENIKFKILDNGDVENKKEP
tara:strand:- start:1904 stop:2077 length:174 start_codon:yes stop_codon:yes gene_type:complete